MIGCVISRVLGYFESRFDQWSGQQARFADRTDMGRIGGGTVQLSPLSLRAPGDRETFPLAVTADTLEVGAERAAGGAADWLRAASRITAATVTPQGNEPHGDRPPTCRPAYPAPWAPGSRSGIRGVVTR
jgi:hypothetical protein